MLPCEVWDRLGALRQIQELAVLAAFFCLLFFAAAKKSRCRPAQGRRLNGKHHIADASANTSKPNRPRHESKPRKPAQPKPPAPRRRHTKPSLRANPQSSPATSAP